MIIPIEAAQPIFTKGIALPRPTTTYHGRQPQIIGVEAEYLGTGIPIGILCQNGSNPNFQKKSGNIEIESDDFFWYALPCIINDTWCLIIQLITKYLHGVMKNRKAHIWVEKSIIENVNVFWGDLRGSVETTRVRPSTSVKAFSTSYVRVI